MNESLRLPIEENPLVSQHMADHDKYPIHFEKIQMIVDWFETHTKIYFKNKKDSGIRLTSFSSNQLYASFQISHPNDIVGKKIFVQVQKQLHILKNKHDLFDLFSCHKCFDLPRLEQMLTKSEESTEKILLEAHILKIKTHRKIADNQWVIFHEQCQKLPKNSCVILQDFGKVFTQKGKACIHVFVLFYKVDDNLVWRYIDFFDNNEHGKSDFEFLEASWCSLFKMGVFSSFNFIHIWMVELQIFITLPHYAFSRNFNLFFQLHAKLIIMKHIMVIVGAMVILAMARNE